MSFYCPDCGTEVTDGVRCPDCGHMDEQCASCGNYAGDDGWFCSQCTAPRSHCPACGHGLDADGCTECGAKRPAVCTSCNEEVERGATACKHCGHNPGGSSLSRARKVKKVGYVIPVLVLGVIAIGGALYRVQQGEPIFDFVYVLFALAWGLILTLFITVPCLFLSRRWKRRADSQTVDTIPS